MGVEDTVLRDVSLCRKDDERQENQGRKQGVEQQHRNDRICPKRLLLEDVVEAKQSSGNEC